MSSIHSFLLSILFAGMAWGSSGPVAKVNGRELSQRDLEATLMGLNEAQRTKMLADTALRAQLLGSLVDQEVLFQEAEKMKLDNTDEYRDSLSRFRKTYLTNAIIQARLGAQMTEELAKKYYSENARKFSTDQVQVMHILVATEAEAKKIITEVSAAGADFNKIAETKSKDPSAKNNRGSLGYITYDRLAPEFAQAAFSAKAGSIVGPVHTSFGYHVLKVGSKKEGKVLSYDEVEPQVKGSLRQELIGKLLVDLKKSQKIELY